MGHIIGNLGVSVLNLHDILKLLQKSPTNKNRYSTFICLDYPNLDYPNFDYPNKVVPKKLRLSKRFLDYPNVFEKHSRLNGRYSARTKTL